MLTAEPSNSPLSAMPRVLGIRVVHEGWGRFLMVRLAVEGLGEIDREVEDHGEAVSVLPYDPIRRVALLVRQMRTPAFVAGGHASTLEAPAGRLEGDDPAACAAREAFEEAGVVLRSLEPVAVAWPMPAVSTETIHLFLAPFDERAQTGPGGGLLEEGERVTVETWPLAELARMADNGSLIDMKTLVLLLTLRHRHPELFAS